MQEYYYELEVTPSSHGELFSSLLLDLTQQAIEETSFSIIVRTEEYPSEIVYGVESFAEQISETLGQKVTAETKIIKKQNKDWVAAYQGAIQPLYIPPFYIRPSWHEPRDNTVDVLVDPALAFGSGHHETTSLCLEMIAEHVKKGNRLLDVGCGSGILSLAATKLGAQCDLCDTDELAIESSRTNFKLNGVESQNSWAGSARLAKERYDFVVANITADILQIISEDLRECLKEGALLLLSGILLKYRMLVINKYADLDLVIEKEKGEWCALLLKKGN